MEVKDGVVQGRSKDLVELYLPIQRAHAVIVHVKVGRSRVLSGERVQENVEVVAVVLHPSKLVRKVLITYDRGPQAHSVGPAVAMNRHISVILSRLAAWGIDRAPVVFLLVDLDSKVDHVVVEINFDSHGLLHGCRILREHHVLGEVVLGVKLSQVVATYLIRVEVCAGNSNNVSILAFISRLESAVHIDRSL